jgi:hypothetical protein
MIKAKDLSPDQKTAIESLLARSIAENEEISIRATISPSVPDGDQLTTRPGRPETFAVDVCL